MLQPRTSRMLPRIGTAFGTALALVAFTGEPAFAAGSSLYGEGLHIAAGALVDPDGRTWVADHNGGFCRMTLPGETTHAQIEHPQHPGDPGLRTCLGGLLPDAGTGPDAAGAPVFVDPTPQWESSGDEVALIPDGASPSSDVVRARWNPNTRLFEFKDIITMVGARVRPTSLSLGPDDAVYVGFQRGNDVQRIVDPAGELPRVEVVANLGRDSAQIVAAGRDADGNTAVYTVEATGLRVIRPDTGTTATAPVSFDGLDPATAIGAMYSDLDTNKLYIGTAAGLTEADAGRDAVIEVDTQAGTATEHARGFSMVGGLAKTEGGNLYVLDDPALLDPAEPMGTGRLFHVGLPGARAVSGPRDDNGFAGRDRHTADRTPTFTVTGDGAVQCRIRGNGIDTGWDDCGENGGEYSSSRELANGEYTLSVRATQNGATGLAEHYRFTVDTVAPLTPEVKRPADGSTISGTPWFEFLSEEGAEFQCAFDDEPLADCEPGRTRKYTENGAHTLRIVAIDRAGNRSAESATVTYTVDTALPPTPAPGWGEGPPSHKGSSLFAGGLHIATGAIVDPNGRTWVADHNGGFCRVTDPSEDGPGTLEHPQLPADPGARTCLGGLLPEAGTGPDAAGQPVFVDPTPSQPNSGDEMALIPDGARPSSDVVRARWNPDTGLFEFEDIVTLIGARIRATSAALGADGNVYVVFQDSGTVQRISNPTGETPRVDVVGTVANGRRAGGIAAGRDELGRTLLYIIEDTGITELVPNAANPPVSSPSSIVLPAGAATAGAMIYDLKRDHLYIGTAEGTTLGADVVHRFSPLTGGEELRWLEGYSMIGGLSVRPDGVVYVMDDPALLDPAEPLGTGRLFHVGLPAAHIGNAPAFVNTARPAFTVTGEETVQCRLRGLDGTVDTGWVTCESGTAFQPQDELADGRYVLAVRSVVFPAPAAPETPAEETPAQDTPAEETPGEETPVEETPAAAAVVAPQPIITGLVEVHAFTVDTVAPARPTILTPTNGQKVGAKPWFSFGAEEFASFRCSWDGAAFTACSQGESKTFTTNGNHTLAIQAVDRAGNESPVSDTRSFDARGVIEKVTITKAPEAVSPNPNPVFEFDASAVDVEFACRLNNRAFASCNSPKAYSNLADGAYTFEVQGRDAQGNLSEVARHRFVVDRSAPALSTPGFGQNAVTGQDVSFPVASNEGALTLACSLDGGPAVACGTSINLTGLALGEHTLVITATDAAGNVGTLIRRFVVVEFVPPAPPVEPTVTVIEDATGQQLTVRIADIDRRVDLARLQEQGVTVRVIPAQGTKLIRFRIIRVSGNGRNRGGRAAAAAAGAKKQVVATIYRRVTPGQKTTVTLTRKELRRVTAGRYVLEVTPGKSRSKMGKSKTAKFRVTR